MLGRSASLLVALLTVGATWAQPAAGSQRVIIKCDSLVYEFNTASPGTDAIDAFDMYTAGIDVVLKGLPVGMDVAVFVMKDGNQQKNPTFRIPASGSPPGDFPFSLGPYDPWDIDTLQLLLQVAGQDSTIIDLGKSNWGIPRSYRLGVHVENDKGYTDQNYTNGLRVEWGSNDDDLPRCLRWADPFYFKNAERDWGLALAQNMYTPDNIGATDIQESDRPFAGWFYGGIYLNSVNDTRDEQMILELDVGLLGDGFASDVQIWWHDLVGATTPCGWDNHIANDLGVQLSLFGQKRLLGTRFQHGLIDLWGFTKVELGNVFTRPTAGGTLRLGRFYGLGPRPAMAVALTRQATRWALYGFLRVEGKYVLHNGTLRGGKLLSGESVHVVPAKAGVYSREWGGHLSKGSWFCELGFVRISSEIDLPDAPGTHGYWQFQAGNSNQTKSRNVRQVVVLGALVLLAWLL